MNLLENEYIQRVTNLDYIGYYQALKAFEFYGFSGDFLVLVGMVLVLLFIVPIPGSKKRWRVRYSKKILKKINSAKNRKKKEKLLNHRKVDHFVFEELILSALEKRRFKITRNTRYTGDGGIDGRARWKKNKIIIQAKFYSGYISKVHLRDFFIACKREKSVGLFVFTGKISDQNISYARACGIELIYGDGLCNFLDHRVPLILFPDTIKITC